MNIQFYPHHIPNISQYILIVSTFSGHAPVGDSHFAHGYIEQRRHRRDLQKSTGTKTSSAGWSNSGPEREREFRNRPWTGGFFSGTNTITRLIGILMAYSWNCNGIQKGLLLYVKVRMLFQPHQLGKNHVPRWHGGYSGWSHPTVLHLMVAQLHDNLVGGFNHSEKY